MLVLWSLIQHRGVILDICWPKELQGFDKIFLVAILQSWVVKSRSPFKKYVSWIRSSTIYLPRRSGIKNQNLALVLFQSVFEWEWDCGIVRGEVSKEASCCEGPDRCIPGQGPLPQQIWFPPANLILDKIFAKHGWLLVLWEKLHSWLTARYLANLVHELRQRSSTNMMFLPLLLLLASEQQGENVQ